MRAEAQPCARESTRSQNGFIDAEAAVNSAMGP
jgi:hypothetical protein